MRTFLAIPTWAIYRLAHVFLPQDHPWYQRKITLPEWSAGATDLTNVFGAIIWCQLIGIPMILALI